MSNFREQYLEALTKTVSNILQKEALTDQDIQLLGLYQLELSKYEYVSPTNKLANCIKGVLDYIKGG
jgi:hypothetical protein